MGYTPGKELHLGCSENSGPTEKFYQFFTAWY
jgi:hypothetical protein